MGNLQSEFAKELKQEMGVYDSKDIYSIPLPEECKDWLVSGTEVYMVQGVEDEYFQKLNGKAVRKVPKGTVVRKRKIDKIKRGLMKDSEGHYVYEDVKIPNGSMAIISTEKLGIPFQYNGGGYGNIDFVKRKDGSIEYLYYMKKTNLYRVNQTALAVSVKNMKNYSGMGYNTWRNGMVFLHVIPYKPNSSYIGSKILKTAMGLDYNEEVKKIVSFWEKQGIIPNLSLSNTDDGNLVMKPTEVGYASYEPYDILSEGEREIYGTEDTESQG